MFFLLRPLFPLKIALLLGLVMGVLRGEFAAWLYPCLRIKLTSCMHLRPQFFCSCDPRSSTSGSLEGICGLGCHVHTLCGRLGFSVGFARALHGDLGTTGKKEVDRLRMIRVDVGWERWSNCTWRHLGLFRITESSIETMYLTNYSTVLSACAIFAVPRFRLKGEIRRIHREGVEG